MEALKQKVSASQLEIESVRTNKKQVATKVKEQIFEGNEAELTISATKKKLV